MGKHAKQLTPTEELYNEFAEARLQEGMSAFFDDRDSQQFAELLLEAEAQAKADHDLRTPKYDWNVYCGDYNKLSVTAYPCVYDANGLFIETDWSKWLTLEIDLTVANHDIITYLLGDEDWANKAWIDHDEWAEEEFLLHEDAPGIVRHWVRQVNKMTPKEFNDAVRRTRA